MGFVGRSTHANTLYFFCLCDCWRFWEPIGSFFRVSVWRRKVISSSFSLSLIHREYYVLANTSKHKPLSYLCSVQRGQKSNKLLMFPEFSDTIGSSVLDQWRAGQPPSVQYSGYSVNQTDLHSRERMTSPFDSITTVNTHSKHLGKCYMWDEANYRLLNEKWCSKSSA